jgi:hypothetical protein
MSFTISDTNWSCHLPTTNLPTGKWVVQMSTDLNLVNGFNTFTNWTSSTNAGVVTILIPQYLTPFAYAYFRIVSFGTGGATFYYPVNMVGGVDYPSNTWSLAVFTNGMANFSIQDCVFKRAIARDALEVECGRLFRRAEQRVSLKIPAN